MRRGSWSTAILLVLLAWALLVHPRFESDAVGQPTNTTTTTSFDTSSETQTTTETDRVDTFATRLVVTDPVGGLLSDETLPALLADATVQAAVTSATAALLTGPPASLFVKGPTLVTTTTTLVDSDTLTMETGRDNVLTPNIEETIGPTCTGTGNRDIANTTPCDPQCSHMAATPPAGDPTCIPAGTNNFNINTHIHTVIHELQTTTETYRTTETYALRGSFLDHFLFYKVKGAKTAPKLRAFGPLTLTDTLGGADYDVKKLPALGLPANKNSEGVADDDTHLAQYALKRRKGPKFAKTADVAIVNQCGGLTLTLAKPESLLVPVSIDLATLPPPRIPGDHEVDHLLCYKAKAQKKLANGTPVATLAKGTQVDVVDDFQSRRYDLKKVTRLCVPVTTAGTPLDLKTQAAVPFTATALRHGAGHLVCYQAKAASKTIQQSGCGPVDPKAKGTKIVPKPAKHEKQLGVGINGPLGPATLDTAKEVELCVPSTAAFPQ